MNDYNAITYSSLAISATYNMIADCILPPAAPVMKRAMNM